MTPQDLIQLNTLVDAVEQRLVALNPGTGAAVEVDSSIQLGMDADGRLFVSGIGGHSPVPIRSVNQRHRLKALRKLDALVALVIMTLHDHDSAFALASCRHALDILETDSAPR